MRGRLAVDLKDQQLRFAIDRGACGDAEPVGRQQRRGKEGLVRKGFDRYQLGWRGIPRCRGRRQRDQGNSPPYDSPNNVTPRSDPIALSGAKPPQGNSFLNQNRAEIAFGAAWLMGAGFPAPAQRRIAQPAIPACASAASSSRATMLVILIIGFTAGPAVSL